MPPIIKLYPFQKSALDRLGQGRSQHLICVAPTGAGKSRIFHEFLRQNPKRTLLFTPLIALGEQHRRRLEQDQLKARFKNSRSLEETLIWILSPESLQGSNLERLKQWKPEFVIVDECHCLFEWGEDFRSDFKKIPELLSWPTVTHSLWLSATLVPEDQRRLLKLLPAPSHLQGKISVPQNLELISIPVRIENRIAAIEAFVKTQMGAGIIFVNTQSLAKRIVHLLKNIRKSVLYFSSGISAEEKNILLNKINSGSDDIVVATSAFGMGMDYPHFKWVLMAQIPFSLVDLTQKLGRIGRSTQKGKGYIFWDESDFKLLEWSVGDSKRRIDQVEKLMCFFRDLNLNLNSQAPKCLKTLLEQHLNH